MTLSHPTSTANPRVARRYLRPPVPLHFPVEELVPEGEPDFSRRVLLYQIASRWLGDQVLVTSDQFVYFDATDPKKSLAPDLALRVGVPDELVSTWKTWERGAPHVGVEIVSPTEDAGTLVSKLGRYRQAGIAEVVVFDPENARQPVRFWDLVEGDLVERDPSDPEVHRCDALGLYWCVKRHEKLELTLRLARDAAGTDLLASPEEEQEAALAAKNAALAAKDAAVAATEAAVAAKDAALARIAELEAELAKRR